MCTARARSSRGCWRRPAGSRPGDCNAEVPASVSLSRGMDEELARLYSRWRVADETDRDDEADAAFRALSEAVLPERAVPREFTARTTDAIAHAMAADARRASRSRKALVWGGGTAAIA